MEALARLLAEESVDQWGVCSFADVLPLLPVRAKGRVPENAASILILLYGYYIGDYANRNISRYAIVDDYHTVIRQRLDRLVEKLGNLYSNEQFIPFVDSSPIAEVRAACLAGLGEVGMNGQLLNPVYGSYCFISELVTTLALPKSVPFSTGLCTRCGKCVAACPTGALTANGFQKERCRSHITQKKGALTLWEQEEIRAGGFVWGCDRCTDACPVNRRVRRSAVPEFYRDVQPVVCAENAGRLCGTKAYGWRGENMLLRNLRIISGENVL